MLVLCRRRAVLESDSTDNNRLADFQKGQDVFKATASNYNASTNTFDFYFPVVLPRSSTYQAKCDISIQYAKANNILILEDLQRNVLLKSSASSNGVISSGDDYNAFYAKYSSVLKVFSNEVTPVRTSIFVNSITPNRLSSYGGELVTISGGNLWATGQQVSIKLQGITCAIQTLAKNSITCITGIKPQFNILELLETTLTVGNASAVVMKQVTYIFDFADQV